MAGTNVAANADNDKDGISNALEYVLGGDPAKSDVSRIVPKGVLLGGNYILSFKRSLVSKADTKTAVKVEYGNDLVVWNSYTIGSTSSDPVQIISSSGMPDSVTVTIPTAVSTRFFTRLKVVIAP